MSLRGTAASTTASVRGTHLMADECCFANSAPCAGPICGANSWPYGITVQLVPESKFESASHVLARSLFMQPKHAQTMSDAPTQSCWPPAEIQARITRDAPTENRKCNCFFAHMFRFRQTCRQNRAIENLSGRNRNSDFLKYGSVCFAQPTRSFIA